MKTDDASKAAAQLEAFMIRHLLSEVRTTGNGLFGKDPGAKVFADMLDEALSDHIASAGGFGIAKQLERNFLSAQVDTQGKAPSASSRHSLASYSAAKPSPALNSSAHESHAFHSDDSWVQPTDGRVTSHFGIRKDPIESDSRAHHGVDLAAPLGTPVVAARSGEIAFVGERGGYGNVVVINHGNGLETRYAHLNTADVKPGQSVSIGTKIGEVGSTGRSTGPHLHFEVRQDGIAVDPNTYIAPLSNTVSRSNR